MPRHLSHGAVAEISVASTSVRETGPVVNRFHGKPRSGLSLRVNVPIQSL